MKHHERGQHGFRVANAVKFGVSGAVIMEHVAFLVRHNNEGKNSSGMSWLRQSIKEFHLYLPYLSIGEIRREISKLVSNGYLLTKKLNRGKFDRTNWYSINYEKLGENWKGF